MTPKYLISLDTRRVKVSEKYPVKLRITYRREQKYYPLGIDLTKEEFANIRTDRPQKELRDDKTKLLEYESKANRILQNIPDFSFRLFERKFFERSRSADDIYPFFEEKISRLEASNRLGTAISYRATMNSLKKFAPKIGFKDISEEFLRDYERWNLENGNSTTTVGIYIRTLRAIFNEAISDEVISRDYYYPFGKRKYQIPTSRNIKKALSLAEIQKIFEYAPEPSSTEARAVDFWKFSYLCNGMNMKDIAYLKYGNIDGEFIKFRREKTKETSRTDGKMVSAFIDESAKDIIRKWGNKNRKKENYIFPIVNDETSEEKKRSLIQQFIKTVNKYMKSVATTLSIDKPITTYCARHSYATVMKRSGASVEFISESLGHSSVLTTASYLDSFEDERKKEMSRALTAFNL